MSIRFPSTFRCSGRDACRSPLSHLISPLTTSPPFDLLATTPPPQPCVCGSIGPPHLSISGIFGSFPPYVASGFAKSREGAAVEEISDTGGGKVNRTGRQCAMDPQNTLPNNARRHTRRPRCRPSFSTHGNVLVLRRPVGGDKAHSRRGRRRYLFLPTCPPSADPSPHPLQWAATSPGYEQRGGRPYIPYGRDHTDLARTSCRSRGFTTGIYDNAQGLSIWTKDQRPAGG